MYDCLSITVNACFFFSPVRKREHKCILITFEMSDNHKIVLVKCQITRLYYLFWPLLNRSTTKKKSKLHILIVLRNFLHFISQEVFSRFIYTRRKKNIQQQSLKSVYFCLFISLIICRKICLEYIQNETKRTYISIEMNDELFSRRFWLNGRVIKADEMDWMKINYMYEESYESVMFFILFLLFLCEWTHCMNIHHLCQDLFDELFVLFMCSYMYMLNVECSMCNV